MIRQYAALTYQTFTGLSTDTKPTGGRAGDEFWELDTGQISIFDGGSTWYPTVASQSIQAFFGTTGGSGQTPNYTNFGSHFADVVIHVITITGTTPSLNVVLQAHDLVSGVDYTVLQSANITVTGYTEMHIGPGLAVTANLSANAVLPRTWNIAWNVAGAGASVDFSVGVWTI